MGATITVMVVSERTRKVCKKYKWRKRGMRSKMTIIEWIKSRIKSDTNHQITSGQHSTEQTNKHNHKCGVKRYINQKRRGHTILIGNNCPRRLKGPKVVGTDLPSLSPRKSSNIRCKPQNFEIDSKSFNIGIDDHASTTISNRLSNFVGPITPGKGKMVKGFGGVVQVKGEGDNIMEN